MASGEPPLTLNELPAGYRFVPTEDELIVYYLKKKILGQALPVDVIPTTNVFASRPDKLPFDDFKDGKPREWFFFSTKSKDDSIIIFVDGGYYAIERQGADPVKWEGETVGFAKTFNFFEGSPPTGTKTKWTVKEFKINPEFVSINKNDHSVEEKISNLVVCKISEIRVKKRKG